MINIDLNNAPAFEELKSQENFPPLVDKIVSYFARSNPDKSEELKELLQQGSVDQLIQFAEQNFIYSPGSNFEASEKDVRRYFVFNANELTKIYLDDEDDTPCILAQYGFSERTQDLSDVRQVQKVVKSVQFFKNDIRNHTVTELTSKFIDIDGYHGITVDLIPASIEKKNFVRRLDARTFDMK